MAPDERPGFRRLGGTVATTLAVVGILIGCCWYRFGGMGRLWLMQKANML